MLFGNLGAPAKARPEVPDVRGSESSKGTFKVESGQSPVRLVWASPAMTGRSSLTPDFPQSRRSRLRSQLSPQW